MVKNIIEQNCGLIPEGFIKVMPKDSNYIFQNDPNFSPINLYDFFARAVTVNSFQECFYYVELGFEQNKISIFDYFLWLGFLVFLGLIVYNLNKKQLLHRFLNHFENNNNIEKISYIYKNKKIGQILFIVSLLYQFILLFDYVQSKALSIPRFIDEYITLTSNVNFFRSLDFDAGSWLGGNYSVVMTTGPVSAIGSVIGWNLTNNVTIARVSNFFWIFLIQTIFAYFVIKEHKIKNTYFIYLSTAFVLILIPWWQGSLYSIGEIPSTILFINAAFLFSKFRKTSILLFCLSVVYGKLLMALPFIGFYIAILIKERSVKNLLRDISLFLIAMSPWLALVQLKYQSGNLINYLIDQSNFIMGHKSSGVQDNTIGFFENFISLLNTSEFINWSIYEKIRVLVIPLIFMVIIYKNKDTLDNYFGNITAPILSATTLIYLWFWVLNGTKWIRYSQHFTIILLISTIYMLGTELIKDKVDIFLLLSLFTFYIDNNKNLIYLSIFIYFVAIFLSGKKVYIDKLKYILLIILFIDISLVFYENTDSRDINQFIDECSIELKSDSCRDAYMSG